MEVEFSQGELGRVCLVYQVLSSTGKCSFEYKIRLDQHSLGQRKKFNQYRFDSFLAKSFAFYKTCFEYLFVANRALTEVLA